MLWIRQSSSLSITQAHVHLVTFSSTDFKYNPKQINISRSCSFGFGNRSNISSVESFPSPNKYNVSKFPVNNRTTSLGFSRDKAVFGTITV